MDPKARKLRTATAVILLIPLALWLIWDIYVASNSLKGDTISEITRDLSHGLYFLPFSLGGIMGHFFFNAPAGGRPNRFNLWLGVVAAVALFDVLVLRGQALAWSYANTMAVTVGFGVGAYLWPQTLPSPEPPSE